MNNQLLPYDVNIQRIAEFIFEAGMLRKTPRTGYQFLGTGSENVAEHSFRVALIGFILGCMSGKSPEKIAMLCLFHDFHEARTGDQNYVNYLYNKTNPRKAIHDALKGTGLEEPIQSLWDEQENKETYESLLAHDADQIDLIFNLVNEKVLGNTSADQWLESVMDRVRTPEGKKLAKVAVTTDPISWWRDSAKKEWWIFRDKE